MRPLNCIWFDDSTTYIRNLEEYTIKPLTKKLEIGFMSVLFGDERGLSEFSRGIYVHLVLVDHNLVGELAGPQIIEKVRAHKHNNNAPIIYYSSNIAAVELQRLVEEFSGVICCHRNELQDYIIRFLRQF